MRLACAEPCIHGWSNQLWPGAGRPRVLSVRTKLVDFLEVGADQSLKSEPEQGGSGHCGFTEQL